MISDMKITVGGSVVQTGSQSSITVDSPIDPNDIVRMDALVLEKTSHPLRLAPFLVVANANKSVLLQSCRASHVWNPEISPVCSVFGTCSWLDENYDDQQTHTVGFFAVHPSISSELVVYIIDGKEHDDDKDYLECRKAAVDVFKTRVMNLPSSSIHATRTVGFSSMKASDSTNSSLHVRQCLRELAGMLCSVVGVLSAEALLDIVNTGFSANANAFHNDALFDGVRKQMARRCWLKDMRDVNDCFLNGDMDLVQYAGSYGTMVTAPLSVREEDSEARYACRVVSSLCASPWCHKQGKKRCPTCLALGLGTRFCSEACLKRNWSTHNLLHKEAKVRC